MLLRHHWLRRVSDQKLLIAERPSYDVVGRMEHCVVAVALRIGVHAPTIISQGTYAFADAEARFQACSVDDS